MTMKLMRHASRAMALAGAYSIAGVALAQTTTSSTTPGVPDTGSIGDLAFNATLLAFATALAVGAAAYLYFFERKMS